MKAVALVLSLLTISLTTIPAFAGSCGGGDHTHETDGSSKENKTGTLYPIIKSSEPHKPANWRVLFLGFF